MALLEVACFSLESAIIAGKAGADRIELCADQRVGGTTPPLDWLDRAKENLSILVFVMIRPRGGDFMYMDAEFIRMKADIAAFKTRAFGFVFGILDGEGRIDVARTAELVREASPLPCTFHRAFDETPDLGQALEDVVTAGCHAILSSGGATCASDGAEALAMLIERAQGRIVIMPGGGVRSQNLEYIRRTTGARMFHSSAVVQGDTLPDAVEIELMKRLLLDASEVISR